MERGNLHFRRLYAFNLLTIVVIIKLPQFTVVDETEVEKKEEEEKKTKIRLSQQHIFF